MIRSGNKRRRALRLAVIVLAALMLGSCNKRNKHKIELPQTAISIGVDQAGTKAIIDDPDNTMRLKQMIRDCYDAQGGRTGGFGVHGYKTVNNSGTKVSTKLFDNMRIYPDLALDVNAKPTTQEITTALGDDAPRWTYTPTRYWDSNPNASYQFIAYWPWVTGTQNGSQAYASSPSQTDLDADYDAKTLTIHNIPNWQTVNDDVMDFMTATQVGTYANNFSTGIVSFSFNHVLSQLVIKAYYVGKEERTQEVNGVITGGVRINSITLSAYTPQGADETAVMAQLKSDGKIVQDESTFRTLGGTTSTLTQRYDSQASIAATLAASYQLTGVSDSPIVFKNEASEDDNYLNNFTPSTVGHWLIVPHVWYKLNMTIDFNIGNTNKVSSAIPVALASAQSDYVTRPGSAYVLTLIFDTTGGGFTVEQVAVKNWNEIDVDKEVYNW